MVVVGGLAATLLYTDRCRVQSVPGLFEVLPPPLPFFRSIFQGALLSV